MSRPAPPAAIVDELVARLHSELGLLTGGSRTAQSRQQTLRATLDWSYDLLTEPEPDQVFDGVVRAT